MGMNVSESKSCPSFSLFSVFFAISILLHGITKYWFFDFSRPDFIALIAAAFALLFFPSSQRLLLVTCVIFLSYAWSTLPFGSNHTLMIAVTSIGIVSASAIALLKPPKDWFSLFAPYGRQLLLILYFFGVFHKLNSDWFNPTYSCASVLWLSFTFPLPDWLTHANWAHNIAIYGTLIIESLILLGLLKGGRFTMISVLCGMAFHGLIGLNTYRDYWAFSAITIALHSLYFPSETLSRWKQSFISRLLGIRTVKLTMVITTLTLFLVLLYQRFDGNDVAIYLVFTTLLAALALFLLYVAYPISGSHQARAIILSPSVMINLLAALFFLNCCLPYLGLKTQLTLSMFSNLRIEFGQSNHFTFSNPPYLFHALENPVIIHETSYPPLKKIMQQGLVFVERRFQAYATAQKSKMKGHSLDYSFKGKRHSIDSLTGNESFFKPLPVWEYKLLGSNLVFKEGPAACRD